MMRALILLHRWLGVAFCLLFAMWFASGIVMHVVPFPTLTEAERVAGLMPLDASALAHGLADAIDAGGVADASRIRLVARPDGLIFIVSGGAGIVARRAADLTSAAINAEPLALEIAVDHARRRGMDTAKAAVVEVSHYDQWTVPNKFDPHRPLYRVALNDAAGSELYVSSVTGEVLLDTVRHERLWNYAGSVTHWIYPTILRSNWAAWDRTVWWLSLFAVFAAASGALLGIIRIRKAWRRIRMSLRGWHAWHHVLGLLTMTFILTWIISGWLSMDHGRLFSRGTLTEAESRAGAASRDWWSIVLKDAQQLPPGTREVGWFALDRNIYQRVRTDLSTQVLHRAGSPGTSEFLQPDDIAPWVRRFAANCRMPEIVGRTDNYHVASTMPFAPVYRAVCGDVWFHVDGANGVMIERLDPSRRAYRWFYSALHTLDLPVLLAHPVLRSVMIIGLCGLGFMFSVTGVVLGWRRLRV